MCLTTWPNTRGDIFLQCYILSTEVLSRRRWSLVLLAQLSNKYDFPLSWTVNIDLYFINATAYNMANTSLHLLVLQSSTVWVNFLYDASVDCFNTYFRTICQPLTYSQHLQPVVTGSIFKDQRSLRASDTVEKKTILILEHLECGKKQHLWRSSK